MEPPPPLSPCPKPVVLRSFFCSFGVPLSLLVLPSSGTGSGTGSGAERFVLWLGWAGLVFCAPLYFRLGGCTVVDGLSFHFFLCWEDLCNIRCMHCMDHGGHGRPV